MTKEELELKNKVEKETEMRMISKFIGEIHTLQHAVKYTLKITDINDIFYKINRIINTQLDDFNHKWEKIESEIESKNKK